MVPARVEAFRRRLLVGLSCAAMLAATAVAIPVSPAAAAVTSVRGEACAYYVNVGLFGGPQSLNGCNEVVSGVARPPTGGTDPFPTDTSYSPHVKIEGTGGSMTATDTNGAKAQYGPAVIHGGQWPCEDPGTDPDGDGFPGNCPSSTPASGPQAASTEGSTGTGTVTASADISQFTTPVPVGCYAGHGPNCVSSGGFGPFPVEGESLHVECTATETSLSGSTTFVNATHTFSTDAEGAPLTSEPVPANPPVNYTRHGVITNVGDVFTAVYNQHIYNADGSLTVNAVHMYLFGPTAVGEVIRGQVTCGTNPHPTTPADTLAPSCGTPVVAPMGPEDPTPKSPRQELVGTADPGGIQSVTNIQVTNGTVQVGMNPDSSFDYLKFVPGQTGPLTVLATRTEAAEAAELPLSWSFDVTDVAGNTVTCRGVPEPPPVAGDDSYTTNEGVPLTVPAPGVLANDSDPGGRPLSLGSPSDPSGGTVQLRPDGGFTYTPDTDFSGDDTFTYPLSNDRGGIDSGTVTITVVPKVTAVTTATTTTTTTTSPSTATTTTTVASGRTPGSGVQGAGQVRGGGTRRDSDRLPRTGAEPLQSLRLAVLLILSGVVLTVAANHRRLRRLHRIRR